jgi:large conductance mechanosensitive channel
MIGDFINAVLTFLVLATVIYFLVVLPVERLMERFKPATTPAPETTRECPHCLSKIPKAASRCAFCTAEVNPITADSSIRV